MVKKIVFIIIIGGICFLIANRKILFRDTISKNHLQGNSLSQISNIDAEDIYDVGISTMEKADEIATKTGIKDKIYKFLGEII